jgi:hypothetical protein
MKSAFASFLRSLRALKPEIALLAATLLLVIASIYLALVTKQLVNATANDVAMNRAAESLEPLLAVADSGQGPTVDVKVRADHGQFIYVVCSVGDTIPDVASTTAQFGRKGMLDRGEDGTVPATDCNSARSSEKSALSTRPQYVYVLVGYASPLLAGAFSDYVPRAAELLFHRTGDEPQSVYSPSPAQGAVPPSSTLSDLAKSIPGTLNMDLTTEANMLAWPIHDAQTKATSATPQPGYEVKPVIRLPAVPIAQAQ